MIRIKQHKPGKALAIIICLTFCLSILNSYAQVLPGLQSNFAAYQKANLHEKIYVHTNKNFYLTGEILWFKIYNTDGSTNKLLDISKVVYVELLDNNHNAVMQARIGMSDGTGNGSLFIPFSLSSGNYTLRAYTNWMKNFDAAYFFQKQITIVNPVKASPVQVQQAVSAYDVQFFPEGGHLVKSISSKIAFKVTAPDGNGQACTGVITDQQNDTVARFKSLKFGIGSFSFIPLKQTGYKAIIKVGRNIITKELPEINESGYVMQATDNNEGWNVSVKCSDDKQSSGVYVIVHSHNAIKLAEHINLSGDSAHFNIDKNKLDNGISYITLFNDQQTPLCERLIFKRPGKNLIITGETDQHLYNTRKKVSLIISAHNKDNISLPANLSIAVFRADSLQKEDAAHIAGYLWLSADVKGHIESPDYYLDNDNNEANQALNDLLLSQGWTQFDWSKISSAETPHYTFLPEYTGPVITGSIVNKLTNEPAKNITAYITITGDRHQLYVTKSDSTGKLLFNTKNFYGLNEIVVQTKWKHDSTYKINISSPFSEQYNKELLPSLNISTDLKTELINNSLNMQVQNIFDAKQLKQFTEPLTDSILFYGTPTYTYKLDDYTRFTTMEEVIHEYVRMIGITSEHNKKSLQVTNENKTILTDEPLVMLDGRPVFDLDKTFVLDPLKIKRLDVINNSYLYGPVVFNGILSFTTYTGVSNNIELDPRSVVLDYEGLQLQRKFYSPVYNTEQQVNSTIPDFRNTLYWNPNVNTDQTGQNKLTFYTSDKPGLYIGIIEGITSNGETGSQQFSFEVKK